MAIPRSQFHIIVIFETYLLIYGGVTEEAQQTMELYDTESDAFIGITANIDAMQTENFASLILFDSLLVFFGGNRINNGESVEEVEYMDFSNLLSIDQNLLVPCLTKYIDTINGNCREIDKYLFNEQTVLYLDIYDDNAAGFEIEIDAFGGGLTYIFSKGPDNSTIEITIYDGAASINSYNLEDLNFEKNSLVYILHHVP